MRREADSCRDGILAISVERVAGRNRDEPAPDTRCLAQQNAIETCSCIVPGDLVELLIDPRPRPSRLALLDDVELLGPHLVIADCDALRQASEVGVFGGRDSTAGVRILLGHSKIPSGIKNAAHPRWTSGSCTICLRQIFRSTVMCFEARAGLLLAFPKSSIPPVSDHSFPSCL
jgi:hypothetical protein